MSQIFLDTSHLNEFAASWDVVLYPRAFENVNMSIIALDHNLFPYDAIVIWWYHLNLWLKIRYSFFHFEDYKNVSFSINICLNKILKRLIFFSKKVHLINIMN